MVRENEKGSSRKLDPEQKGNAIKENQDRGSVDIEFNRDPSITRMGVKFALGSDGEYEGNPYKASCKFRTKDVVYDPKFGNYKVKIPYMTMAAIFAWIKEPGNLEQFQKHFEKEKEEAIGIPCIA